MLSLTSLIMVVTPIVTLISCSSISTKKFGTVEDTIIATAKGNAIVDDRQRIKERIAEKELDLGKDQRKAPTIHGKELISVDDFLKIKDLAFLEEEILKDESIPRGLFTTWDSLLLYFLPPTFGDLSYVNAVVDEKSIKINEQDTSRTSISLSVKLSSNLIQDSSRIWSYSVIIDGFAKPHGTSNEVDSNSIKTFIKEFANFKTKIDQTIQHISSDKEICVPLEFIDKENKGQKRDLTAIQATIYDYKRKLINEELGIYLKVSSVSLNPKNRDGSSLVVNVDIAGTDLFHVDSSYEFVDNNFMVKEDFEGLHQVKVIGSTSRKNFSELPHDEVTWVGGPTYFALNQTAGYLFNLAKELGWTSAPDVISEQEKDFLPKDEEKSALEQITFNQNLYDQKGRPQDRNILFDSFGATRLGGVQADIYQFDASTPNGGGKIYGEGVNGANLDLSSLGENKSPHADNGHKNYEKAHLTFSQEWFEENGVLAIKIWDEWGHSHVVKTPEKYARTYPKLDSGFIDRGSFENDIFKTLDFAKKQTAGEAIMYHLANEGVKTLSPDWASAFFFLGTQINSENEEHRSRVKTAIEKLDGLYYYPALVAMMHGLTDIPEPLRNFKEDGVTKDMDGFMTMDSLINLPKWGHIVPGRSYSLKEFFKEK